LKSAGECIQVTHRVDFAICSPPHLPHVRRSTRSWHVGKYFRVSESGPKRMNITHYPTLVFVVSLIVLGASAWIGTLHLSRHRRLEDDFRPDHSIILTATLTLFGLVVGFTFSMAVDRYDQRTNYESAESNVISTEYLRADLLPTDQASRIRTLLKSYVEQRILAYTINDESKRQGMRAETARLQTDLWSAVQAPATANPTSVVALAVSGMNDVFNSQGDTLGADRNRIPTAAWVLMVAIGICCNLLVGWGFQGSKGGGRLLAVLPLVSAVAFMLIADIDTPRHGIIRIQPRNLISLEQSMRTNSVAPPMR
jgi:hypothetical protein